MPIQHQTIIKLEWLIVSCSTHQFSIAHKITKTFSIIMAAECVFKTNLPYHSIRSVSYWNHWCMWKIIYNQHSHSCVRVFIFNFFFKKNFPSALPLLAQYYICTMLESIWFWDASCLTICCWFNDPNDVFISTAKKVCVQKTGWNGVKRVAHTWSTMLTSDELGTDYYHFICSPLFNWQISWNWQPF